MNMYNYRCSKGIESMWVVTYLLHMYQCFYPITFSICVSGFSNLIFTGELDTFIVYNERKRVTSSAKRKLKSEDRSLHQVNILYFAIQWMDSHDPWVYIHNLLVRLELISSTNWRSKFAFYTDCESEVWQLSCWCYWALCSASQGQKIGCTGPDR